MIPILQPCFSTFQNKYRLNGSATVYRRREGSECELGAGQFASAFVRHAEALLQEGIEVGSSECGQLPLVD